MRWHVKNDHQPRSEVQNVYANDPVTACELVAEVHGIIGVFLVKDQDRDRFLILLVELRTCNHVVELLRKWKSLSLGVEKHNCMGMIKERVRSLELHKE